MRAYGRRKAPEQRRGHRIYSPVLRMDGHKGKEAEADVDVAGVYAKNPDLHILK